MGLRNPAIYSWLAQGLSDNREPMSAQVGDCRVVQNLIHDPTSKGVLAPRPGATLITSFTGFTTPGIVSLIFAVGTRIYGLLATGRNVGYDEPFCYDTSTNAFITISGVTSGNVPLTQPSTGPWTPPQAALVGTKLVVTHPGFPGGTTKFGWFDLTNPAAPVWNAGDVSGGLAGLPSTPTAVGTFFNRAWYACGPLAVFSDILAATTVTNAGQSLRVDASDPIIGFAPQPLTTGTQGILSALLIFKAGSIWQVTGDYNNGTPPGNLALNELTDSVGCNAARTITATPNGVFFLAPDGVRSVALTGTVSEPQPDVVYSFYNVNPASRACADYSADVYRICVTSISNQGTLGEYDFWYSLRYQRWTGPHTFVYDDVTAFGNSFVLASNGIPGKLWMSNPFPSSNDQYTENGVAMNVALTTTVIDPQPQMAEKAAIEMEMAIVPTVTPYNVQVLTAQGAAIATATLLSTLAPATWGSGTWGIGFWTAAPYNTSTTPLNFPIPLVFKTCVIALTGAAAIGLRIGHFSFRYEALGYTGQG